MNLDNPLTFSVSHSLDKEIITHFMPLADAVMENGQNVLGLAYKNKSVDVFSQIVSWLDNADASGHQKMY